MEGYGPIVTFMKGCNKSNITGLIIGRLNEKTNYERRYKCRSVVVSGNYGFFDITLYTQSVLQKCSTVFYLHDLPTLDQYLRQITAKPINLMPLYISAGGIGKLFSNFFEWHAFNVAVFAYFFGYSNCERKLFLLVISFAISFANSGLTLHTPSDRIVKSAG